MEAHTKHSVLLTPAGLLITEEVIRAYAELTNDFNPIHVDAQFAANTPMGRPIAHGTLSICLIWQSLQRSLGADVFQDLQLDIRFVKPIYIGDEIYAGGKAVPDQPGHYQIWVRGADETDRVVGTAIPVASMYLQKGDGA